MQTDIQMVAGAETKVDTNGLAEDFVALEHRTPLFSVSVKADDSEGPPFVYDDATGTEIFRSNQGHLGAHNIPGDGARILPCAALCHGLALS